MPDCACRWLLGALAASAAFVALGGPAAAQQGAQAGRKEKVHVLFVGGDWKAQLPNYQGKTPLRGHFIRRELEKAAPGRFELTLWTSYEFLQYGEDDSLRQFDVIVVGDIMGQSVLPRLVEAVRRYVEGGGKLLLTVDAGTLGSDGEPAAGPLLSLAGVTLADTASPQQPADLKISPPNGMPAALADLTLSAEHRRATVAAGTDVVLSMTVGGEELPLLTRRRVGEGEVWYLAAKLGPPAFEDRQLSTHYRQGGFRPPRDANAITAIQRIAALILGGTPAFRVEGAPRGLLASVYRTQRDDRPARAIHLLNCSGRDLQAGDPVEFDADNPPPMPPVPEMTVVLPGKVSRAALLSPESAEPLPLSPTRGEGTTAVAVPAGSFSTYGVIWAYD